MTYNDYKIVKKKSLINDDNPLVMLIAINLIVFVTLNFIQIAYLLGNTELYEYENEVLRYFTLPGKFAHFLHEPWAIITHMFTHTGVWQLIGNMLFLWGFGFILQDLSGIRHIAPLYLYGGLVGAAMLLLSMNLIPRFEAASASYVYAGAGASVMAIAAAATMLSPFYRIFPLIGGGIPLWIITAIYLLIDLAGLAGQAFPYHLAHLSGALAGVLYIFLLRKGTDAGLWMHTVYNGFFRLFSKSSYPLKNQHKNQRHFYKTNGVLPFKKTPNITQQKIDALLDKINQQGLDALTEEEKSFLKRASEKE